MFCQAGRLLGKQRSRALADSVFSRRAAGLAALGKNLCGPEMLVHRLATFGTRCLGFSAENPLKEV